MKRKRLCLTLSLLLAAVALGTAVWMFLQFDEGCTQQRQFQELSRSTAHRPEPEATTTPATGYLERLLEHGRPKVVSETNVGTPAEKATAAPSESVPVTELVHDLPALQEENPDCIGWVRVSGTGIDYPVMWTPDEPDRYLHRGYWGEESNYGVPYLDARCTLESGNLILYGHNMFDGAMFTPVLYYTDPEVLASCSAIQVEIGGEVRTYRAFAAAHTTTASPIFRYVHLTTPEAVADFLAAVQAECGQTLDPKPGMEFVTLVTCDVSREDGRAVVIGVRVS